METFIDFEKLVPLRVSVRAPALKDTQTIRQPESFGKVLITARTKTCGKFCY